MYQPHVILRFCYVLIINMQYSELDDTQLGQLIESRWADSSSIWGEIEKVTKNNTDLYDGRPGYWKRARIPNTRPKPNANRIFVNPVY